MAFTGKDLVEAGIEPGRWFGAALQAANEALAEGQSREEAVAAARLLVPSRLPVRAKGSLDFHVNIEAQNEVEAANVAACVATMRELMRTPVVEAGAIMPDACPAGPLGTIPVGGVAASRAIHPGMHSADICCSMALSVMPGTDPAALLDAVHAATHFGPGGRRDGDVVPMPAEVAATLEASKLMKTKLDLAASNFATQGDGNHFAYVGTLRSTGETVLVTHHGSRGPGAALYKDGMRLAERTRLEKSPETLKANAWIEADTADGDDYWAALQAIRVWTKASHFAIHDRAAERLGARVSDRFWNEHNFVFRKSDGLFYHAKGATPAFPGWAADAGDLTLIPLNMAQPILIVRGSDAPNGLGFSPHGAGRNFSRTRHRRLLGDRPEAEIVADETEGIDARFFCGIPDVSELPGAYKDAATVRAQIARFRLAEVVDEVIPHGCIMAGDWERDAPWRRKKSAPAV